MTKISEKQRKKLTQGESQRNLRKKIQDKIKIFATRIPVFMYLTEYREETLRILLQNLNHLYLKVV